MNEAVSESTAWDKPLIPKDFDDYLSEVSAGKREALIAAYIAAAAELGDTFYYPSAEQRPARAEFEKIVVRDSVEAANFHLHDLLEEKDHVDLLYVSEEEGEIEKTIPVHPKSMALDGLADALLEAYRGLTPARPATIREALRLVK